MGFACLRYCIPQEIERWETWYRGKENVVYKKVECKVWVDEGGEFLMPHKYEAWMERQGFLWRGPVLDFDVEIQGDGRWGPINFFDFGGELINPDPMEVDGGNGYGMMEIDGHENDVFADGRSDSEPEQMISTPEDSGPEELPSSEDSGAETE